MRRRNAQVVVELARQFGFELGRSVGRMEAEIEQLRDKVRQNTPRINDLLGGPDNQLFGFGFNVDGEDCNNPDCPIHGQGQTAVFPDFFGGPPEDEEPELDPVFDPDERV